MSLDAALFMEEKIMLCEYCKTEHEPEKYYKDPFYCIARMGERIEELEMALRLNLGLTPDDPILITPAEKQIADLKEANSSLAGAAIEKPPYKADLINQIAALTEELRLSGLRGDSLDRVVEEGVQKELALEVENSILREQNSDMNASLVKLRAEVERLLDAVKFAYRKHHLGDDFFGWEELSGILLTALCESMGDEGYQKWLAAFQQTEGDDK